MTKEEEYVQRAFAVFYKVVDSTEKWCNSDLKTNILELNKQHLLANLDKALVLDTEVGDK